MKNSEIIASHEALNEILRKNEKYPVRVSYAISKNAKALENLMMDFETERNKLLDRYNASDEEGTPTYKKTGKIDISEEFEEEWKKDMTELLDIDVEFNPHMVPIVEFPEAIEPRILHALFFMIEE